MNFEFIHPGFVLAFAVATVLALIVAWKHVNPGFKLITILIAIVVCAVVAVAVWLQTDPREVLLFVFVAGTTLQLVFASLAYTLRRPENWHR